MRDEKKFVNNNIFPGNNFPETFIIFNNLNKKSAKKSKSFVRKHLSYFINSFISKFAIRHTNPTTYLLSYFVVIRAIRGFLDTRIFALISDLHADNWIHVETSELPRFYDRNANLVILGF